MRLPPEVQRQRSKGKVYFYWAPGRGTSRAGPRHRLPGDPEKAEFWAAIERLGGSNPNAPAGSIGDLVKRYRESQEFLRLAPSSRKTYNVHLDRFADPEAWGLGPARQLTPVAVHTLLQSLAETPVMANQMLSVGGTVWDWAIPLGLVPHGTSNPFSQVKPLRVVERGHIPWPDWASDYVLESAPPDLIRFVKLALWTGQRESDLVLFGPCHRENNGLWCRPQKTAHRRREFFIPLGVAEAAELDRWAETPIRFQASRWKKPIERYNPDHYVCTPKGQAYNPDRIRRRWSWWLEKTEEGRELCRRWKAWVGDQVRRFRWEHDPEEMRGPTIHGLRGAAVRARRRDGYEAQAIANDIGMSLPMVMHYTRFIDQMSAAEANRRRFEVVGGAV